MGNIINPESGSISHHNVRYWKADLGRPAKKLTLSHHSLTSADRDWVQPDNRWALFLFSHTGSLLINNRTYLFRPGWACTVPPAGRAGFSQIEAGTEVLRLNFDLEPEGADPVAIPVCFQMFEFERWTGLFFDTIKYLPTGIAKTNSVLWSLLWQHCAPASALRQNELIYTAEEWIAANISKRFTITELAEHLKVSSATLLRAFRNDHGMTVQEYVRLQRSLVARRLLIDTNLTLKAIGARVGLFDPQQFNKLMRTFTGLSPKRFRDLHS